MMSEIFPGNVRGLASSLSAMLNWLLSFTVTETFNSFAANVASALVIPCAE
jgi:SP family facilitated glucose transporter-like MFS transporter 8